MVELGLVIVFIYLCIFMCSEMTEDAVHLGNSLDISAEALHVAIRELGRVTGKIGVEDILDVVFKDFCIGK